jgi:D-alanine-D-alanine ligase
MNKSILLFGGRSDERLVSVASAQNLIRQTEFSELLFIRFNGEIVKVSKEQVLAHLKPFEVQWEPEIPSLSGSLAESLAHLQNKTVFLGLHGTEGEDGEIQKLFENNGIAYTGSDSRSSRMCFNKIEAKKCVEKHGLKTAEQISFSRAVASQISPLLQAFFQKHGAIVIKPAESGSSFGLQIIHEAAEIPQASAIIENSPYDLFLVESFLVGRELTVGVIQSANGIAALPPSEVVMQKGRSFDYKGKYLGQGSTEITPADLNSEEKKAAQALAVEAHKVLGCYGYTRTDMILSARGPVFLETNTLPGLSGASFVPQQLQVEKVSMKTFVEGQLSMAENRLSQHQATR